MALTQSAWTHKTVKKKGNSTMQNTFTCTVAATTAENDAYTLKTPKELDSSKPWTLFLKFAATPDGAALPLDLWVGYDDDFILSGDGATVAATSGAKFKQVFDDVVLAVDTLIYTFLFDPDLAVADVVTVAAIATGPKVKIPVAPYYAFNANGASTLAATTATYVIVQ